MLLVRLLFCLFAEDTGILREAQFQDYLEQRTAADGSDLADRLATLFHAQHAGRQALSNAGRAARRLSLHQRLLFAEPLPPWPTSTPPCARPCSTPAGWTGA
jgi:hypothetical protein